MCSSPRRSEHINIYKLSKKSRFYVHKIIISTPFHFLYVANVPPVCCLNFKKFPSILSQRFFKEFFFCKIFKCYLLHNRSFTKQPGSLWKIQLFCYIYKVGFFFLVLHSSEVKVKHKLALVCRLCECMEKGLMALFPLTFCPMRPKMNRIKTNEIK